MPAGDRDRLAERSFGAAFVGFGGEKKFALESGEFRLEIAGRSLLDCIGTKVWRLRFKLPSRVALDADGVESCAVEHGFQSVSVMQREREKEDIAQFRQKRLRTSAKFAHIGARSGVGDAEALRALGRNQAPLSDAWDRLALFNRAAETPGARWSLICSVPLLLDLLYYLAIPVRHFGPAGESESS